VIFFFWLKYDNSVILGYGEHRIQGTRRLVYMYTLSVRPGPAAPLVWIDSHCEKREYSVSVSVEDHVKY
jgi:hypothetical protein